MERPPFRQIPFAQLNAQPVPPHSFFELPLQYVEVASEAFGRVRVAYRSCGQGEPLLLVHGLMTSSYSWRYVMPLLGAHHRVYAIDLVGCGDSDKPARRYHAPELGMFVAEVQRALDIAGCRVIGNSMGGYLCMWLALQQPDAMAALVNIHSPGVPLKRLWALRTALKAPAARRLLDWMVARDPRRWVHRNVHYWDESRKSLEEADEYARPLQTPAGREAFTGFLADALDPAVMRRFVQRLERAPLEVPLQLIYARRDPMVPPAVGRRLRALLPDAELVWLDSCSHFAHVDRPRALVDAALPFLQRHPGRAAPVPAS